MPKISAQFIISIWRGILVYTKGHQVLREVTKKTFSFNVTWTRYHHHYSCFRSTEDIQGCSIIMQIIKVIIIVCGISGSPTWCSVSSRILDTWMRKNCYVNDTKIKPQSVVSKTQTQALNVRWVCLTEHGRNRRCSSFILNFNKPIFSTDPPWYRLSCVFYDQNCRGHDDCHFKFSLQLP